jgi:hypothetical protein
MRSGLAGVVMSAVLAALSAIPMALPAADKSAYKPAEKVPAAIPGKEIMLPESAVPDRFYSYLIGLVNANVCGVVDDAKFDSVLRGFKGKTQIPFEKIKEIRRECVTGSGTRDVSITFKGDLDTPVPYSILGYHPGSVTAGTKVSFLEWYTPSQKITVGRGESIVLADVFVFGVYDGWAVVDIDTWVDRLLGGLLDDTRIIVLVLFKYKGEWHALAAGYDRQGNGRSGVFNFHTNRILFPTPKELQVLAPYFRNFVALNKHLKPPSPPAARWKTVK